MEHGADSRPVHQTEQAVVSGATDSAVTLGMVVAALELQRRTNLALYRLVRGLIDGGQRTGLARRTVQRVRRHLVSPAGAHSHAEAAGAQRPGRPAEASEASPRCARPTLQVRCFGRFEVIRDGQPIERWRRGKAKTLLKYLLVRRQPVPRDVLMDLLWPDADPQNALNGLRVALYALRQALGPLDDSADGTHDYVICDAGSYCLNPAAVLWVDADEFARRFDAGLRLEHDGQVVAAIRQYEQAEAVYRDDYLLEDLYEDWTLVRREELKDQYLMILTKLADACLRRGDAEGCILRCHKILQKDTCREDAYQRLMRCYHQLGQRSQALHWFDVCARTLSHELDVGPSEATLDLYQRIVTGQRLGPAGAGGLPRRIGRRPVVHGSVSGARPYG